MSEKLNIGDVVQLKSGGQPMTVNGIDAEGNTHCLWYNMDTKNVSCGAFHPYTLTKCDPLSHVSIHANYSAHYTKSK